MPSEIATPLTMQVLQRRKQLGEFHMEHGDSTYARLRSIVGYHPRLFIADVEEGTDAANPNPPVRIDRPDFYSGKAGK